MDPQYILTVIKQKGEEIKAFFSFEDAMLEVQKLEGFVKATVTTFLGEIVHIEEGVATEVTKVEDAVKTVVEKKTKPAANTAS